MSSAIVYFIYYSVKETKENIFTIKVKTQVIKMKQI